MAELGGDAEPGAGTAARQRALPGFYFSPVNFYFCERQGKPATCWPRCRTPLEPAPLLPAGSGGARPHDKDFHVSPFMGLAMRYHWRIRPPKEETLIHIESHPVSGEAKLFDATLALRRAPLSRRGWRRCWPAGPG